MLDIAMPKIEVVQAAENYGRFKIEPLDPCYGHTLGNALRRVLLASIPGSAITKIKIVSVYHEIWTDGTIKAGDALSHAAQVLVQYAQTISGFNQLSLDAEVAKSPEGLTIPADIYDTPIEELDLSTRTYNCLKRADITKVGQVL